MNMTSSSVSVDLQTLLEDWKVTKVMETTIDFNVLKVRNNRVPLPAWLSEWLTA
jgi:hypothetical protein